MHWSLRVSRSTRTTIVSIVSVAFLALRHVADYDDIVPGLRRYNSGALKESEGIQKSTALPIGTTFAAKLAFAIDSERLSYTLPATT